MPRTPEQKREGLAAHARSKRTRTRCETFSETLQLVPCSLSSTGFHRVHIRVGTDGQFMGLRCQCDLEHGEENEDIKHKACRNCGTIPHKHLRDRKSKRKASGSMAAYRLGQKGTCGHAMGLVRMYVAGKTGHDDEHELRKLFPNLDTLLSSAARRARQGREGNRLHKPAEYRRSIERILSKRASKAAGMKLRIRVENRIVTSAECMEYEVARRRKGTGWLLVHQGVKQTAEKVGRKERSYGYDRGRGDRVYCTICKKDITGTAQVRAHFSSDRHREKYENALVDALGALPGCGCGGSEALDSLGA
jgi:hypothetical protein